MDRATPTELSVEERTALFFFFFPSLNENSVKKQDPNTDLKAEDSQSGLSGKDLVMTLNLKCETQPFIGGTHCQVVISLNFSTAIWGRHYFSRSPS